MSEIWTCLSEQCDYEITEKEATEGWYEGFRYPMSKPVERDFYAKMRYGPLRDSHEKDNPGHRMVRRK